MNPKDPPEVDSQSVRDEAIALSTRLRKALRLRKLLIVLSVGLLLLTQWPPGHDYFVPAVLISFGFVISAEMHLLQETIGVVDLLKRHLDAVSGEVEQAQQSS